MSTENAAPEHDTDSMDEAAVNAAIGKMAAGEEVTTEPAKEPEPTVVEPPLDPDDDPPDDVTTDGKPKSETVPFGRFDHERNRRKTTEGELKTERENRLRLEERLKVILEAQQPKAEAPKEPEIPDPEVDPIGYIKWDRQQKMDAAAKAKETEAQTEQQRQEQEYVETVFNDSVAEFQATAAVEPDLPTMYEGVWNSYINELRAAGIPEQNLVQQAQALEKQHMLYAKQQGIPIVQYLKGIAKARNINIQAPTATPPAAANDPARDAEGKFKAAEKREQAKQAGASLGNTGGAVANMGGLTVDQVLNMDDAEFKAYMDANGGSLRKAYNVQ